MAKSIEVTVLGATYESRSKACRAYNHSPAKIDHRMRAGATLEEALLAINRYQGKKSHPLYGHWNGMRSRCYSKSKCGIRYRAKGIVMCDSWKENFWAFVEDMGEPPMLGMSIDRIDNEGNYEPENCRWATRKQQQRNMKSNTSITIFSETKLLVEWSEISGLSAVTIRHRLNNSIPPEIAVTTNTREGAVSKIKLGSNRLIYKQTE